MGSERLRLKPAYYNENDSEQAAWLRELIAQNVIAHGDVDERSIKEVWPEDLACYAQCHFFAGIGVWSYALRLAGWPDDRPVWTGSCPCPSFSAAGKGKGFDDPRHLWPDWTRLIRKCRPATLFGEQADDAIGYGWLDLVQTDLERENYAVGKAVLGACSVGAPHIRQRLYFVAHAERSEALARLSEIHARAGKNKPNGFGVCGGSERMDDSAGARCDNAGERPERKARDDAWMCGPESRRATERLEHANSERCRETRNPSSGSGISGNGTPERLADSDWRGLAVHGTTQRETGHVERGGESNLGKPIRARLERHDGHGADGHESRWFGTQSHGSTSEAGYVNGFWRDADWVLRKRWNSDDSEWCPTEPGTFPLAHGVANRVLKLRGYGDAIVAEVAKTFIEVNL